VDLEGVVLEGMELGQLDIDDLFVLDRAGSLGGSRRRFSLNGSLYFRRTFGGLGCLGGFLCFAGGSGFFRFSWLCGFLYCFILLARSFLLCGSGGLVLVGLGRSAPALRCLFLLFGLFLLRPVLLGRRRGCPFPIIQ